VKPEDQPRVRERLKALLRIPFRFENEGTHIVLYQPDEILQGPHHGTRSKPR